MTVLASVLLIDRPPRPLDRGRDWRAKKPSENTDSMCALVVVLRIGLPEGGLAIVYSSVYLVDTSAEIVDK